MTGKEKEICTALTILNFVGIVAVFWVERIYAPFIILVLGFLIAFWVDLISYSFFPGNAEANNDTKKKDRYIPNIRLLALGISSGGSVALLAYVFPFVERILVLTTIYPKHALPYIVTLLFILALVGFFFSAIVKIAMD